MSEGVQTLTKTLNDAQRAWLKKIAAALGAGASSGTLPAINQTRQDGIGPALLGEDLKVSADGANSPSPLQIPPTQRADTQPAPKSSPSATNESTYRGNLAGILDRLNKALGEKPQDTASIESHKKLRDVYDKMTTAEMDEDFVKANKYLEDLLPRLNDYEKARDAYQQKAKREADQKANEVKHSSNVAGAKAKVQEKYERVKDLLDDVINNPTSDLETGALSARATKLKQDYNAVVLAIPNEDLNAVNAIDKQLDDLTRDLSAKLTKVRDAYSKNVASIASHLEPVQDYDFSTGDPISDVRKRLIEAKKKLGTISSYIAANALVDEFKRKLPDHAKYKADAEENRKKQAEASKRNQAALDADLKALKAELDRDLYPPAADPPSLKLRDELQKWKADWDAALKQGFPFPSSKYGSAFPTAGVDEIKRLFKEYVTTSQAFWKQNFESDRKVNDAEIKSVLAQQGGKGMARKIEALNKEIEAAVSKNDYYQAVVKLTERDQLLFTTKADKKSYDAALAKIKWSVNEALSRDWKSKGMTKLQEGVSAKKAEMEAAANNDDYKQAIKHAETLGTLATTFNNTRAMEPGKVTALAAKCHKLIDVHYHKASASMLSAGKVYNDALKEVKSTLEEKDAGIVGDLLLGIFIAAISGGVGGAVAVGLKKLSTASGFKDSLLEGVIVDASKDVAKFVVKSGGTLPPLSGGGDFSIGDNGLELGQLIGSKIESEAARLIEGLIHFDDEVIATRTDEVLIEGHPDEALEKDPFLQFLGGLKPNKQTFALLIWRNFLEQHVQEFYYLVVRHHEEILKQTGSDQQVEKLLKKAHEIAKEEDEKFWARRGAFD